MGDVDVNYFDDDDLYMMRCLSRKMITSYPPGLSAKGAKWDACWALPAIGRLWPSDDDAAAVTNQSLVCNMLEKQTR